MINAVVNSDDRTAYFFASNLVFKYDMNDATEGIVATYPRPITTEWADFPFASVDAAVRWSNGRTYFFRKDQYVAYKDKTMVVAPTPIKNEWLGLPDTFKKIDAVLQLNANEAWIFSGAQCHKYDVVLDRAKGKPLAINAVFKDLFPKGSKFTNFTTGIDAAVLWNNQKIYLFKGDEYVKIDPLSKKMEAGYPRPIIGPWIGLNNVFIREKAMFLLKTLCATLTLPFSDPKGWHFFTPVHNEIINRVKDDSGKVISIDFGGVYLNDEFAKQNPPPNNTWPGGTTCGFLCHWFLWRLGLENIEILNRTILNYGESVDEYKKVKRKQEPNPSGGMRYAETVDQFRNRLPKFWNLYIDGANISKLTDTNNGYFRRNVNDNFGTEKPKIGDIIHIKLKDNDDHVFIFLKELVDSNGTLIWETIESGQNSHQKKTDNNNNCDIQIKKRTIEKKTGKVVDDKQNRIVDGWLSLDKLKFNEPKLPSLEELKRYL